MFITLSYFLQYINLPVDYNYYPASDIDLSKANHVHRLILLYIIKTNVLL